MRYFGSFGLNGDYTLFAQLLQDFGYFPNTYDIIGFSSGALSALQYAMQCIAHGQRIGKLILLSPLLYTHHITQDSILHIQNDIDLGQKYKFIAKSFKNRLLQAMPCVTHVSFETLAKNFIDIQPNILWNLFTQACFYSYKKDILHYHHMLYSQLGFYTKQANFYSFYSNTHKCEVFTHFEKLCTLRHLWHINPIDFSKIQKKVYMFVIFVAENDRILNSKQIADYLSQFGICYIIKGCNHIFQQDGDSER